MDPSNEDPHQVTPLDVTSGVACPMQTPTGHGHHTDVSDEHIRYNSTMNQAQEQNQSKKKQRQYPKQYQAQEQLSQKAPPQVLSWEKSAQSML